MSERLTKWSFGAAYGVKKSNGYYAGMQECLNKLYEIENIIFDADGNEIISLSRLRELAEAEREGRTVVLPCRVGDLIYDIRGDGETGKRLLVPHRVRSVYTEQKDGGTVEWEMYVSDFAFRVTKNTQMYFTRAEAERALAATEPKEDHIRDTTKKVED